VFDAIKSNLVYEGGRGVSEQKNADEKDRDLEGDVNEAKELYNKVLGYHQKSDPEAALWMARKATESICTKIFINEISPNIDTTSLDQMVTQLKKRELIPKKIEIPIRTIQGFGNFGVHAQSRDSKISSEYVEPALKSLSILVDWYIRDYLSSHQDSHPEKLAIQASGASNFKRQLNLKNLLLLSASIAFLMVPFLYFQSQQQEIVDKSAYDSLARKWRQQKFSECHNEAANMNLDTSPDVSIPVYWRIVCFRDIDRESWEIERNPDAIAEIKLEFERGLKESSKFGGMTDDIIYQRAHFSSATGDLDSALKDLALLQSDYPESNWKQGTVYYTGLLSLSINDQVKAAEMLDKLKSFTLSDGMYDFESKSYVAVRSAIMQLQHAIEEQSELPANDR
jgi:hypothetical protein